MLERTVGAGKVRVEVAADMDFDRLTTNTEEFNPDGQVIRSTQTTNERSQSTDQERQQTVSVANNLPDAAAQAGNGTQSNNSTQRTEETVNYEVSKTVRTLVREAGVVRRQTVAVMIDGTTPRSAEDMTRLGNLVRSAIGYNQARGDEVTVDALPFAAVEQASLEDLSIIFGMTKDDLFRVSEIAILGLTAMLIVLLVVRPVLRQVFAPADMTTEEPEVTLLADEGGMGVAAALAAPAQPPGAIAEVQDEIEQMIDINRVEGRVKASSLKKIGEIVDKHPEEAVSIIRYWMFQET